MEIFTIGHSNRTEESFIDLLNEAGVDAVVDVRSMPGSRHNPQFNAESLRQSLPARGVEYHHIAGLGGRRRTAAGPSPNDYWRERGFRNFADHALTHDFREGFRELEDLAGRRTVAVMCSEAVWWRCHRRIITDYLLADDVRVRHILGPKKIDDAVITPAAVRHKDGTITYPGRPEDDLPLWEAKSGQST